MTPISTRVPDLHAKQLRQAADEQGKDVADIVRESIALYLAWWERYGSLRMIRASKNLADEKGGAV